MSERVIHRMAEALVALEASRGAATYHDLTEAGFTPAEIDRHKHEARARAARMRRQGKPGRLPATTLAQAKAERDQRLAVGRRAITRQASEPRWSGAAS